MLIRFIRAPLLHFFLLGAALFLAHHRLAARRAPERIVVSAAFVDGLREEHRRHAGRPPSAAEERGRIERFLDEEVLYREAVALGLDRGDLIVRRRLVQKMELLAEAGIDGEEPGDEVLARHLAAHAGRWAEPPRVGFRHVFVARDRHADAEIVAARHLAALRAGADPGRLGDPFLDGDRFAGRSEAEIAARFGPDFAAALVKLQGAAWHGPLASPLGLHLVHIEGRQPGAIPPLATIRARVRDDFLAGQREAAVRASIAALRAKYRVEIEPAAVAANDGRAR